MLNEVNLSIANYYTKSGAEVQSSSFVVPFGASLWCLAIYRMIVLVLRGAILFYRQKRKRTGRLDQFF
ncbi:hypothetical protein [Bacillus benzoevorans]|uniref:Uncharacterized protein n=1 Tax=Bacillus benzoevorans TaxID=1456 RepID=A0A7X0HWL0_9BACI|nr:hypothetical protein [Bacillus benzoevorans]MBB6447257.1 hypothetical protein [Bacillus benzoevorans]